MMNEFVREAYIAARESDTGEVSPHYGDDFDTLLRAHNRKIAARALREFADTLGVNVGDEDDEWWRGYRQGQREALHKASDRADRIEQGGQG